MTTIAYRDGVIAGDTLVSAGGLRVGAVQKVGAKNGVLYAAAGTLANCQRFMDWVEAGLQGDPPSMKDADGDKSEGFVVEGDNIICFTANGADRIKADRYAAGSGWQLAMAAMEMGADAEQAVRVACKLDTRSGGEIVVLKR